MSKTKEHFHEEINQGMTTIVEPYIFRFVAHFKYMGKPYTIFADTLDKIEDLAGAAIGQPVLINHGPVEGEYVFMFEHWDLPIILFSVENAYY